MFHLLSLSQAIERCHFWLGAYFDLTPSWVTPAFFPEMNDLISASHSQNRWFLSPDIYFHWKSLVFKKNDLTSPEYYSPLSDLLTHCVNTSPRPHPFPTRTVWVSQGQAFWRKLRLNFEEQLQDVNVVKPVSLDLPRALFLCKEAALALISTCFSPDAVLWKAVGPPQHTGYQVRVFRNFSYGLFKGRTQDFDIKCLYLTDQPESF